MSVKRVLEDLMRVLYEDGMSVTRITMPATMRKSLEAEVGPMEPINIGDEFERFNYKGDFKDIMIITGNTFSVEVE